MMSYASLLLAGTLLTGQVDELQDLREAALGKWVRQVQYEGQPHRWVKNIEESTETVSVYAPSGKLIYQHVVDYEINLVEKVGIFSFWNLQVIVGPEKEEQSEQDPDAQNQRTSYVFRIYDNKWYEIDNVLNDAQQAPQMSVYLRLTGDEGAPMANIQEEIPPGKKHLQELAFMVGSWQNIDDEKDQRVVQWINNQSYMMLNIGDYREIIGWDLVHECIVSWSYGTDGGQGRGLWTKEGNKWQFVARNFLDRWGKPMQPFGVTIEQLNDTTMKITSLEQDANGKPTFEATFKRTNPEQ